MSVLQEWLEEFVNYVKDDWFSDKKYDESEYDELGEIIEGITAYDVGEASENYVKEIVELLEVDYGMNYVACRTERSWTPSDIWCIKNYNKDNYVHIMLLQVKGTITQDEPESLSGNFIKKFRKLAKLTKKTYANYEKPNNISEKYPLVVSYGYAGVFTEESKDENGDPIPESTGLFNPHYIDKVYDKRLKNKIVEIESELRILHELE